jgi:hypothetical protein
LSNRAEATDDNKSQGTYRSAKNNGVTAGAKVGRIVRNIGAEGDRPNLPMRLAVIYYKFIVILVNIYYIYVVGFDDKNYIYVV